MNLSSNVSLNGTKGKVQKKKKKSGPLKTEINFITTDDKEKFNPVVVPVALLIIAVLILVGKFAVVDRYSAMYAKQAEVQAVQDQIDLDTRIILEAGDMIDRYYHYTWSGMTEAEKEITERTLIMDLVSFISQKGAVVHSISLSGNQLGIDISAATLKDVSLLASAIEGQEIAESVSVASAQRLDDITYDEEGRVLASITVYIKSKSEVKGD